MNSELFANYSSFFVDVGNILVGIVFSFFCFNIRHDMETVVQLYIVNGYYNENKTLYT